MFVATFVLLAGALVGGLVWGASWWSLLGLGPPVALTTARVVGGFRPSRIELGREELRLRHLFHARRVPYLDIASVHGDVPARLDWSTRLQITLHDGRTLAVPVVDAPLERVRDEIAKRAGLQ